jgi:hypothetical protein
MVMLSLGVLVTIALAYLLNLYASRRQRQASVTSHSSLYTRHVSNLIPLLAILLICFEFLPIPYPVSQIDTPPFYDQLGAENEDYVIAELPMNWDRPTPMLHQTTHHKRLLTAYTSRDHPSDLARRTPVFQQWRYLGPDIIDQPPALIAPTVFEDYNLRYIVLDYWQMPPGPERDGTEQGVAMALPGATPVYDDGRLKVYQAPPKADTQAYLTLGDGWGERQIYENDSVARTFVHLAELGLRHPQKQALVLEITATTAVPQTLTLLADGEQIGQFEVTQTASSQIVNLPPLAEDNVVLTILSNRPSTPVTVSRLSLNSEEAQ